MKLICSKSDLTEAVGIVQKAVSTRSPSPVLECILFDCDETVRLIGNNLDSSIEYQLDAQIIDKGKILVPAKLFGELIRSLDDDDILIETDDNMNLRIMCRNSKFSVSGLNPSDFPVPETIQKSETPDFEIAQSLLRDMIRQTIFSTAVNDSRLVLTGSLFCLEDNHFQIVAVDGFRLALRREEVESDKTFSVIIPAKAQNELLSILNDNEATLFIKATEEKTAFFFEKYTLITKNIITDYINYKQTFPQTRELVVSCYLNDLSRAIKRAVPLITADTLKSPIKLHFRDGAVEVFCTTTQGNLKDEIAVVMEGPELEIGFNHRFLLEALDAIPESDIEIVFTSPTTPCQITAKDSDRYHYVIFPVRLR